MMMVIFPDSPSIDRLEKIQRDYVILPQAGLTSAQARPGQHKGLCRHPKLFPSSLFLIPKDSLQHTCSYWLEIKMKQIYL